jgi:GNAT superfamily N-acetyltransferase
MPIVEVYPDDQIAPVLLWQAIAFMRVEWPFIFQGSGRYAANTYPPELHPVHIVAAESDVLLSYAAAFRLPLTHTGVPFTVFAFGNMFTFPPYRHEGLGQRVLDRASQFIHASGVDLGLLFCHPELAPFYRKSGWEPVQASTYIGYGTHQHHHEALTMALYVSEKGKQAKERFDTEPLVVAEAW